MGKKRTQITQIQHASFSGPIPPPNILAGYNAIEPGLADRIMKMAEHQSEIDKFKKIRLLMQKL